MARVTVSDEDNGNNGDLRLCLQCVVGFFAPIVLACIEDMSQRVAAACKGDQEMTFAVLERMMTVVSEGDGSVLFATPRVIVAGDEMDADTVRELLAQQGASEPISEDSEDRTPRHPSAKSTNVREKAAFSGYL